MDGTRALYIILSVPFVLVLLLFAAGFLLFVPGITIYQNLDVPTGRNPQTIESRYGNQIEVWFNYNYDDSVQERENYFVYRRKSGSKFRAIIKVKSQVDLGEYKSIEVSTSSVQHTNSPTTHTLHECPTSNARTYKCKDALVDEVSLFAGDNVLEILFYKPDGGVADSATVMLSLGYSSGWEVNYWQALMGV